MLSYSNFRIGGVVAGTTPVTTLEDTFTPTEGWFHLPILIDEFTLHQFGAVCGEDIFRFIFENVVSINLYIQMEPNPDSAALA